MTNDQMDSDELAVVKASVADFLAWCKKEKLRRESGKKANAPVTAQKQLAERARLTRVEADARRHTNANRRFIQWIEQNITTATFTGNDLEAAGMKRRTINMRLLYAYQDGLLARENIASNDIRPKYQYSIIKSAVAP